MFFHWELIEFKKNYKKEGGETNPGLRDALLSSAQTFRSTFGFGFLMQIFSLLHIAIIF